MIVRMLDPINDNTKDFAELDVQLVNPWSR